MKLVSALKVAKAKNQLSRGPSMVLDFYINGDDRVSTLEYRGFLRAAKEAIRALYQEAHKGIRNFVKSYLIPSQELVKFILETLPSVIKLLILVAPLFLQKEYKATT